MNVFVVSLKKRLLLFFSSCLTTCTFLSFEEFDVNLKNTNICLIRAQTLGTYLGFLLVLIIKWSGIQK